MKKTIEIPEGYEARIEGNKVIIMPKESEDERIRKALIKKFKGEQEQGAEYMVHGVSISQILAYLEKQKNNISLQELLTSFRENTNENWDFSKTPQVREELNKCFGKHMILPWNDNTRLTVSDLIRCAAHFYEFGKKEQNPAWSEEDEEMLNKCIEYTIRIVPVKPTEDSGLLVDFKKIPDEKAQDWIKSFKERCTWKPSDEQMIALKKACDEHWEPDGLDPLYTLYQDLNKLKG